MLRCGVNRSTLEISGRASKLRLFSGGKCGVQRQTPWAQVFIYRKRGADRAESRRAYRLARKRAEHGRLLSGHDEPVPYGNFCAGENLGGQWFFPGQREIGILPNEYGPGVGLSGVCPGPTVVLGQLDERG